MAATASATASAVAPDWLQVDASAAARGFGPAEYGDPATDPPAAVVPSAASPLPPGRAPLAPDAPGTQGDGDGAGAWPSLPASGDGRTWRDRGDGFPQGLYETEAPRTDAPGMWAASQPLQTYDHLSQHVDTAGWDQTVPNDRVSARNTFGQANPDNNPTWYGYSENAVQAHLAIVAGPLTPDAPAFGTPGFSAGQLPDWSALGGQGSTAYDTPAPPPSASAAAVSVADPAGGWA